MVARSVHGPKGPLTVELKEIPKEGLKMDCEVNPECLELPQDEGRVNGTFHWTGEIMKTPEGASVTGTLSGVVVRECVRCLQEFDDDLLILCTAAFKQNQSESDHVGGADHKMNKIDALQDYDDEGYSCVGNQVELGKMLREQVILMTPIQPLCRTDCAGLCQNCGRNLNQGMCQCANKEPLPHHSAIRLRVGKSRN